MGERVRGKITSWKENGYGWATVNGDKGIFIHIRSITNKPPEMREVEVGQEVEFEIAPGKEAGQVQGVDVVLL